MGITAKQKGWEIGEITAEVNKKMTVKGAREIESITIQIFMPINLSIEQFQILQKSTEDCPVTRSLKSSIKIRVNWITKKRRY